MIDAVAFAIPDSLFQTVTGAGFAFPGRCIHRRAVTGQSQLFEGKQIFSHRSLKEKGVENFPEPEAWSHISGRIYFKLTE